MHRLIRALALLLIGCASINVAYAEPVAPKTVPVTIEVATFAGGCFWCMDAEYAQTPGVIKVISGYTGGTVANPTYEEVSSGTTGHVEAVEVMFDPSRISYAKLLEIFWENVDPTDDQGQFCDKGSQYRAEIFTDGPRQKALAEASLETARKHFSGPIAAVIRPAQVFYPAEAYHQDFYLKNKMHYALYREGCGRDNKLQELNYK